jgi:transposase
MLSSLSTEDLIPPDHSIRRIRVVVDAVLAELDDVFDGMYASGGRRSIPPETLLKATVLMAMYSIRSERAFCERLNYDLLFKWFLDMRIDQVAFDATTFSKNRQRLLDHQVADEFFAAVVRQAKLRRYISSDHFSVDGTLLQAWASHKSFKPKDGSGDDSGKGRNAEVQWHGQKRTNDTHASTTDPEACLYRKSHNTAATLCYSGHLLMENRSALIVDAESPQLTATPSGPPHSRCWADSRPARGEEPWRVTRAMTPAGSSRMPASWGSRLTSRRTTRGSVLRSTGAPRAMPAMK